MSLKFKIPTYNNLIKDSITASHSCLNSNNSLNVNFENKIDNDLTEYPEENPDEILDLKDYYSNYKIPILNSDTYAGFEKQNLNSIKGIFKISYHETFTELGLPHGSDHEINSAFDILEIKQQNRNSSSAHIPDIEHNITSIFESLRLYHLNNEKKDHLKRIVLIFQLILNSTRFPYHLQKKLIDKWKSF